MVTGWGKKNETGGNSDVLQKVWLPLINDTVCTEFLKLISYDQNFIKEMICAGYKAGGKDACQVIAYFFKLFPLL